ncbi:hypothetical protein SK128_012262 [Halocaridina rubra]|uniref:Uncharacterized protein n=1 Tax=Halocaridina rubra TaxID=373956 RepID=A0AAN9AGN9_HALRR
MGISYSNMLLLLDVWTMYDLKQCSVCPDDFAEGVPSISIIDNDDFRNDTLTGEGTAHRCNWMFLQHLEHLVQKEDDFREDACECINDIKNVSLALTEKASEMQTVISYRTIRICEPAIRPKPASFSRSTGLQSTQSVLDALACLDVNGGVIADGSVEHALNGKHYKRGLRCLRLMYEALTSQLVQGSLAFDLADETKENLEILRDMSQSQESRAEAHAARQDDVKLESLITNLFNQVEGSDMAVYWRGFLTMRDDLM